MASATLKRYWAERRRHSEVVNLAAPNTEDLIQDLVAIVSSCTARLYGQRRAKRKAEAIVTQLQEEGGGD